MEFIIMKIAYSTSEQNRKLEIIDITFDEFCESLSHPEVGTKLGAYFIRGGELKEKVRKEENLLSSELLILDGDSSVIDGELQKGAPDPKLIHQYLKSKQIKHFIYTSFSNKKDHHRYRVLIPYKTNDPDELRRAIQYIIKEIQEFGIPLANVSENGDWVHAWFFPALETKDSPFKTYKAGTKPLIVPADFKLTKDDKTVKAKKDEPFNMMDALSAISSADNIHDSMVSIANSLSFRGYDRDAIRLLLKGLLTLAAQNDPERAELRDGAHLEQTLDTVIEYKDEQSKIPEYNEDEFIHPEMEWPPGLIGDMCKEAMEMANYPNKTLAIMSSITFIAGIIGRRYNVSGTGLNLYSTLLMDTGMGKSVIGSMINSTVLANSGNNNIAQTYLGSSSFTGAKALWDDLDKGLSKICVMTEAGLMRGQTAGDKKGLERALLDLYTGSGKDAWVGGTQYSSSDNSMKRLNAPALSIIQESTPKSFIDSMKSNDSDISGDLARMWILRINTDKPKLNRKPRRRFSESILKRVKELMEVCGDLQVNKNIVSDGDVIDIGISDYIYDWADKITEKENKYKREGEHLKHIMATRAWVKTIKIASIVDVFNGHTDIEDETFNWANKYAVGHEIQNIDILFSHENSSDLNSVVTGVMVPNILKILNNKFNHTKKVPPKELRDRGIFTYSNVSQVLVNNRVLKSIDNKTDSYKVEKGLDKVLRYMVDCGLLVEKDKIALSMLGSRSNKGYQITDDFNTLVENR